jgi:SAM-dependent methyltransferase
LAHSYRNFQNWNQWLTQHFLGIQLLEAEKLLLTQLLKRHFGRHSLLIGTPHQTDLLQSTSMPLHTVLSPWAPHKANPHFIEADLHELPILTGSIDLAILPHTLEFVDNPRQLLAEACRIIKPEGLIVIAGFNPYSVWGIKKLWSDHQEFPWSGNFIHAKKIKSWLHLADFEMEKQKNLLFRPPFNKQSIYQKLNFLEYVGHKCFPFLGGVYILLARAKVVPLTPIRLKWKQQLSGVRISTTMTGHIA